MAKIIHAFNNDDIGLRQSTAYEATHPLGEIMADTGLTGATIMSVYANRADIPATGHAGAIFTTNVHNASNQVHLPTSRFIVMDENCHASIDTTPYYVEITDTVLVDRKL